MQLRDRLLKIGLAVGQAFQVRVSVPGTTVPFLTDNTDRTVSTPTYLFAGGDPLTLGIDLAQNGSADMTRVRFIDGATASGEDALFDSPKMFGNADRPMVYSVWQGKNLSTNSYGALSEVYALPLGVRIAQAGENTLTFSGTDGFPASALMYLEDTQTHQWTDIRAQGGYTFTHAAGTDESRFILHFYPPVRHNAAEATCEAGGSLTLDNTAPVQWNYRVTDTQDQSVGQGVLSQETVTVNNLAAGPYTLTLQEQVSGYTAQETVTVGGATAVTAQAAATTLTAETGQEIAFTGTAQNAQVFQWSFGDGNSSQEQNPVHAYNAPGVYTVSFTASNGTCQQESTLSVSAGQNTASLEDAFAQGGVKLWNDNGTVYLSFGETWTGETRFTLYDMQGRKVFQKQLNNASGTLSFDCGTIAAGAYNAELKGEKQTLTRKLVIGI